MSTSRGKLIFKNVMPAILANACVFLFSAVYGIFVGRGAGSDALGAVNLALPFVLLAQALNAMASIGGVVGILGASEGYIRNVRDYIFWYALFAIPNALSLNLQSFCQNDGSP